MNYEQEIKKLEAKIDEAGEQIWKAVVQIEKLRADAEVSQEAPPVWEPGNEEEYFTVDADRIESFSWYDDSTDKGYLALGEVFRTEEAAEAHLRALKLIETIRRERVKAQGNWWPSEGETRFTICWNLLENSIHTTHTMWSFASNVFGFWQGSDVLRGIIKKYEPELKWYFTEYLPSVN